MEALFINWWQFTGPMFAVCMQGGSAHLCVNRSLCVRGRDNRKLLYGRWCYMYLNKKKGHCGCDTEMGRNMQNGKIKQPGSCGFWCKEDVSPVAKTVST